MNIVIADTFTRSLALLARDEQSQAKQAAFDFQVTPATPGGSYHRIEAARDPGFWSFRVNRDLRMIVHQSKAARTLCYVDHHDPAYRWAETRRFEVNPKTGAMQVVEVQERVEEVVRQVVREEEAAVFGRFEADYLLGLGVPQAWLPAVRHVGESGIEKLLEHLPQEAAERLLELACGQPVPLPLAVSGSPMLHPDSRRRFREVDSGEQLRQALEAPWASWVVFLHPMQNAVVEGDTKGPLLVTGGAGTGKTVVALHRAARLLRADSAARVLLTTYSKTLALRLQEPMGLLLPPEDAAWSRLCIANLHKLAVDLWMERTGQDFVPTRDADITRLLDAAIEGAGPGTLDRAFLRAEWDAVIEPWGLRSWEAYKDQPRKGRATPLGARQRLVAWQVFEGLWAGLAGEGRQTWSQVCHELAEVLPATGGAPFDHVVADECQDFGPAELKLLRALAPAGRNDLFLCADAGQRIYRRPFTWSAAGIDLRGRSERLRVNYRTTEQIRRFSDGLLPAAITEADGRSESRATISLLSGLEPQVKGADTVDAETTLVKDWLERLLREGFQPQEIAIFGRTDAVLRERAMPAIRQSGCEAQRLSDEGGIEPGSVAVGTMHGAKGLEFRAVALMACEAGTLPLAFLRAKQVDDADKEAFEEQERSLLYVACTRARERLLITYKGRRSSLLEGVVG